MVSAEDAKKIVCQHAQFIRKTEWIPAHTSRGRVLASAIKAPINLPPFDQSAMDGYAVGNGSCWHITGEIKAGDAKTMRLRHGDAARIFTGAPIPQNTQAVIMQEYAVMHNHTLTVTKSDIKAGENIRRKGSQIKKGQTALDKGHVLNPASIGFLLSMGIAHVPVVMQPRVGIIVTGNELQPAGKPLRNGMIYESNASTILAALDSTGITAAKTARVKDNKKSVTDTLKLFLKQYDIVLLSGGISVGDYDFVKEALDALHTHSLFYKIAQKPGKPLYFGKNKNTLVFALPGNPAATLTCFYEYVYPALRIMQGHTDIFLSTKTLRCATPFNRKNQLSLFLKARVKDNSVAILEGQESFILKSFAEANALVYLPPDKASIAQGDEVEVHLLP